MNARPSPERISAWTIGREWGRIGCVGFGGPPAHIALLRKLCVEKRRWLGHEEFEDAIAACNLLPGPASTQLAIFTAWRIGGPLGGLLGGAAFILPGLIVIVALAAVFFAGSSPDWIRGAEAGAGAGVAAVAVHAGASLIPGSRARATSHWRWSAYIAAGTVTSALLGPWVVLVLLGCGLVEATLRVRPNGLAAMAAPLAVALPTTGGLGALAWVALKVGGLSYGGGFVIIPLMQHDAVSAYHWMTNAEFLNAVALGQITPGPVTLTVAVVGYGAAGIGGALLATAVAFAPSFAFILGGATHFDALRTNTFAQNFFAGAGPAAIGAIFGAAIPLARALSEGWQFVLLALAAALLLVARRSPLVTLLTLALIGVVAALAGASLPTQ